MIPVPLVAAAADLCLPPHRYAVVVRPSSPGEAQPPPLADDASAGEDCALLLQARDVDGRRLPEADIELEIYRSGGRHNLMLCRCIPANGPLLWHGGHPVWMDDASGQRLERPEGGERLEALARRLHSLL